MLEWWIEGRQVDEQEALYAGADHREAAGSRRGCNALQGIWPNNEDLKGLGVGHSGQGQAKLFAEGVEV
jgi:hypothetical protein